MKPPVTSRARGREPRLLAAMVRSSFLDSPRRSVNLDARLLVVRDVVLRPISLHQAPDSFDVAGPDRIWGNAARNP